MEIKGISLAMPDITTPPADYNRWYDLDHLPEHVSKADVLIGRRYVAPRDLRGLEGILPCEMVAGYPRYVTIYSLGVEDFAGAEVLAGWKTKDHGLVKAGRFWQVGPVRRTGRWRVAQTTKRASLRVSDEAVPYVAHRGIVVAIGKAPSPEKAEAAVGWWNTTHLPDLLAVPGTLAAIRYVPAESSNEGQMLHVLLLEEDPLVMMPRIVSQLRYSHAQGRYPAFGGVYEPLMFLPYRSITPLEYEFEF